RHGAPEDGIDADQAARSRPDLLPDGQRALPDHRAGAARVGREADRLPGAAQLPERRLPAGRRRSGRPVGRPLPVRPARNAQRPRLRHLDAGLGRPGRRRRGGRGHRQLARRRQPLMDGARPIGSRRARAFTLIELLAVVAIFALLAAVALPNLGLRSGRLLDEEASRLAGALEVARHPAVMTGRPHRVFIDLDRSAYQVEVYGPLADDGAEEVEPGTAPRADPARVELSAPLDAEVDFQPLVGTLGDATELDPAVQFAGVETPGGIVESGQVQIVFERDGTSEGAAVALAIDSGRRAILRILPMADSVRLERVDPYPEPGRRARFGLPAGRGVRGPRGAG